MSTPIKEHPKCPRCGRLLAHSDFPHRLPNLCWGDDDKVPGHCTQAEIKMLRTALEDAQREAEAWEVIFRWKISGIETRTIGIWLGHDDIWRVHLTTITQDSLVGRTRLEALTKAAAWCRAELERAPSETKVCVYHVIDVVGCSACNWKNGRSK